MTRLRRKDFIQESIVILIINVGLIFFMNNISGDVIYIVGTLSLIFLGIQINLVVKRLHDINLSGWYSLILFIPLINLGSFLLYFIDGTKGSNKYGKDSKGRTGKKINDQPKIGSRSKPETDLELLKTSRELGLLTEDEYKSSEIKIIEKKSKERSENIKLKAINEKQSK